MTRDEATRPLDLDTLYRTYGASVLRRAQRLLGNPHDAEEAVHDVFTRVIQHGEQFQGGSQIMTWLYSITTNLCLNRLRDARQRALLQRERWQPLHETSAAPRADRLAMLRELLARMPDELAVVSVHYYLDEMSHAEIAELLGCSRRHVGDLLERARAWAQKEAAE